MSVSLSTIVIGSLAVIIVLLGLALLLVFRLTQTIGAGNASPAPSDPNEGADGDGSDADPDRAAPEAAPPVPTGVAMTEAARAGAEAVVDGVREEIQAALTALRGDLKAWAETAAADAADREVARRLDALQDQFVAELRSATEKQARSGQVAAPIAAAPDTAAPQTDGAKAAAELAAAAPARPGDPGSEAPSAPRWIDRPADPPVAQPSNAGLDLTRPVSYDLLDEASAWLAQLGIDDAETERLRVNAAASHPAESLRRLFANLHKISAERRLAADRPTLKWDRVGQASLADFIGRINPGAETCLIWPRVGEAFDPRTMYHLQKSESGPGVLTEVVAPGYSIGSGEDPVKAAVID